MSVPEPSKILTPWATSGLKNTIPETANPVTGNAGYDQGFPAINMTPKEAGGIPPYGQDFNGILFSVTEALRYLQAGGTPTYSAALSTAIGGYPKGATVIGTDGVSEYRSLVDSNTSDPNTGGANWAKNDSDRFVASLAASGYQKLPSGLIIQWGGIPSININSLASVTYPIAFPNAFLSIACVGGADQAGSGAIAGVSSTGTGNQRAGFVAWAGAAGSTVLPGAYIAIGY